MAIVLADNRNSLKNIGDKAACLSAAIPSPSLNDAAAHESFLRIPPFPGAGPKYFTKMKSPPARHDGLAAEVRRLRVGGSFWAAQPELPENYILAASASAIESAKRLAGHLPVIHWDRGTADSDLRSANVVRGECDPWHMLGRASAFVAASGDELRIIAGLLGVRCFDVDRATGAMIPANFDAAALLCEQLAGSTFENPFTGEPMNAFEAVGLCGFWRKLIDSNRDIAGGIGFAFWKQSQVAPLLWNGSQPFKFMRRSSGIGRNGAVAVWRSKVGVETAVELERSGICLVEVEDGFLRSRGLGADCIPPLSITVDRLGVYFDPSQSSELEGLLQEGEFDERLLKRARELRRQIVQAGLGKYEQGNVVLGRPAGARRHILVPGQVEDDRAVTAGGCGLTSNLELLKRVREQAPEAYVIYKPHPDVVAGHRRGAIPQASCLEHADQIVGDLPISALIAMVDEIHVNTSLAGFEALLREKPVTTYGVPFYAGWGLTRDLGPVPSWRTTTRTLDELVAAALLLYPRYLDPVTGLPCPAEIVVSRLSATEKEDPGAIVAMRRLQGRFMRRLRSLLQ